MAKKLSRRSFMRIAAGAGVATGLSPTVRRVALEPFVRPPEEELPGRATWYASTCRQCPAGCGIIVRVINGRARKIEGNPAHPLNRGKLCARGQAGLQSLYNPDRLQGAVQQIDGRGSRGFEPFAWAEALDQLSSHILGSSDTSRVAFLGGLIPDHLAAIAGRFLKALGAPPPVLFDLQSLLEGRRSATEMSQRWFGSSELPLYDLADAEVIFSFGANFLETWLSPVSQSVDYGAMRQAQFGGRGFLAQFEPRLSATAACADEWIPVRPGTEGLIALGLGRIIVEEDLGHVGSHREHAGYYRNVSVGDVAQAADISVERLRTLARVFADANRSVAIPGGHLAGHTNSRDAMDAVMALNVIMRRIGQQGGVFLPQRVPIDGFSSPLVPADTAELGDLIDRMRSGHIDTLFIHSCNPVYELPDWVGFQQALGHVAKVVSFSSFVDETAVAADMVLPDHTYLEGWGYQLTSPGADRPVVSGQQPVVRPLYDTRSTADVLLSLASRLGEEVSQELPWSDEVAFLEEASQGLMGSSVGLYDARTPSGFWSRWRQHGGWWSENPIRQEPLVVLSSNGPLSVSEPDFAGDESQFPFYLVPYPSLTLGDGRGANLPWLQVIPDPMTTARWNTWVELNPKTADDLGVANNDLVRVVSPTGELEASVVVTPGIRPDTVALPLGQGHTDYGRFAANRGANAIKLLARVSGGGSKVLTWASTRVKVEPIGRARAIARLESLDGEGRETVR